MKNKITIKDELEFSKWFEKNFEKMGYTGILKKDKRKFPDYIMLKDEKKIRVELELKLSNFILHNHPIDEVDEIVCIEKDIKLPIKSIKINELIYKNEKAKRVSIVLDDNQLEVIKGLKGFGSKDAEKVKNLLLAYLSEKGYIEDFNKKRGA